MGKTYSNRQGHKMSEKDRRIKNRQREVNNRMQRWIDKADSNPKDVSKLGMAILSAYAHNGGFSR